jgi:hypothetical protein
MPVQAAELHGGMGAATDPALGSWESPGLQFLLGGLHVIYGGGGDNLSCSTLASPWG